MTNQEKGQFFKVHKRFKPFNINSTQSQMKKPI